MVQDVDLSIRVAVEMSDCSRSKCRKPSCLLAFNAPLCPWFVGTVFYLFMPKVIHVNESWQQPLNNGWNTRILLVAISAERGVGLRACCSPGWALCYCALAMARNFQQVLGCLREECLSAQCTLTSHITVCFIFQLIAPVSNEESDQHWCARIAISPFHYLLQSFQSTFLKPLCTISNE